MRTVLEGGVLPILLLLMIVIFATLPETGSLFTSPANISQLLRGQAITGVVAIAMVIPLVSGYFDLSVAANAALCSVAFATFVGTMGLGIWPSIALTLLMGTLVGVVNGVLVAYFRFNAFVITLGTYILIGGVVQWFTGGKQISEGIPPEIGEWGSLKLLGLPYPFLAFMIVAIVVWYVLIHTPAGRSLESIGSNERAAHLVGVRVSRSIFWSFIASALLAGVVGLLLTSNSGLADPTAGPSYLFPALTAVFLGATSIRPGRYNVWGTVLGIYFVAIAINGFSLIGADAWITPVFNGAALIFAVAASTLMQRSRRTAKPIPIETGSTEPDQNSAGGKGESPGHAS
jgi:ribose transport system permease protein